MRRKHWKTVAAVLTVQQLLVGVLVTADTFANKKLLSALALCSLIGPFVAYIVTLRDAPFAQGPWRLLKAVSVTLLSLALTIVGYTAWFFVSLLEQK